jgi:hypothetical protein
MHFVRNTAISESGFEKCPRFRRAAVTARIASLRARVVGTVVCVSAMEQFMAHQVVYRDYFSSTLII